MTKGRRAYHGPVTEESTRRTEPVGLEVQRGSSICLHIPQGPPKRDVWMFMRVRQHADEMNADKGVVHTH